MTAKNQIEIERIPIDKKVMVYPRNDLLAELPAFAPIKSLTK